VDGCQRVRGLATCGYNAGRRTPEAPTAAASTDGQTAARSAAKSPAGTQAKVRAYAGEMVGDSRTPHRKLEDTHPPRRIEHHRKMPDIDHRRECNAPGPGVDFRLEQGGQLADLAEGRKHHHTQNNGCGYPIGSKPSTVRGADPDTHRDHHRKHQWEGHNHCTQAPNAKEELALLYRDVISTAARSAGNGFIEVEGNQSWERLNIHTFWLMRYMGKGTERLQKMREEIQAVSEGVGMPVQARWILNQRTIKDRERRGEIKAASVVCIVRGNKLAQRLVNKGINAAGVQYKVDL
jgi:hypothetical protein